MIFPYDWPVRFIIVGNSSLGFNLVLRFLTNYQISQSLNVDGCGAAAPSFRVRTWPRIGMLAMVAGGNLRTV